MMKPEDLENELQNFKNIHLTDEEIAAYCDQGLDKMRRARMEAHLKQCFICEQQLAVWNEETAALKDRKITTDDKAFIERLMQTLEERQSNPAFTAAAQGLRVRITKYFGDLSASWRTQFSAVRRGDRGQEVWRWESKDGRFHAYAMMEKNADLILEISSGDTELEGAHLRVRLGLLNQELILRRTSDSTVGAHVIVPLRYRKGDMGDLLIEIA